MSGEIIAAASSLIGAVIGSCGGIKLISYRIEQLEKKVEKHNNVVERMAVMENRMSVADHRIDELETEVRKC